LRGSRDGDHGARLNPRGRLRGDPRASRAGQPARRANSARSLRFVCFGLGELRHQGLGHARDLKQVHLARVGAQHFEAQALDFDRVAAARDA